MNAADADPNPSTPGGVDVSIIELDRDVERLRQEARAALALAASPGPAEAPEMELDDLIRESGMEQLEHELVLLESVNAALYNAVKSTQVSSARKVPSFHMRLLPMGGEAGGGEAAPCNQLEDLTRAHQDHQVGLQQSTQQLRHEVAELKRNKAELLTLLQERRRRRHRHQAGRQPPPPPSSPPPLPPLPLLPERNAENGNFAAVPDVRRGEIAGSDKRGRLDDEEGVIFEAPANADLDFATEEKRGLSAAPLRAAPLRAGRTNGFEREGLAAGSAHEVEVSTAAAAAAAAEAAEAAAAAAAPAAQGPSSKERQRSERRRATLWWHWRIFVTALLQRETAQKTAARALRRSRNLAAAAAFARVLRAQRRRRLTAAFRHLSAEAARWRLQKALTTQRLGRASARAANDGLRGGLRLLASVVRRWRRRRLAAALSALAEAAAARKKQLVAAESLSRGFLRVVRSKQRRRLLQWRTTAAALSATRLATIRAASAAARESETLRISVNDAKARAETAEAEAKRLERELTRLKQESEGHEADVTALTVVKRRAAAAEERAVAAEAAAALSAEEALAAAAAAQARWDREAELLRQRASDERRLLEARVADLEKRLVTAENDRKNAETSRTNSEERLQSQLRAALADKEDAARATASARLRAENADRLAEESQKEQKRLASAAEKAEEELEAAAAAAAAELAAAAAAAAADLRRRERTWAAKDTASAEAAAAAAAEVSSSRASLAESVKREREAVSSAEALRLGAADEVKRASLRFEEAATARDALSAKLRESERQVVDSERQIAELSRQLEKTAAQRQQDARAAERNAERAAAVATRALDQSRRNEETLSAEAAEAKLSLSEARKELSKLRLESSKLAAEASRLETENSRISERLVETLRNAESARENASAAAAAATAERRAAAAAAAAEAEHLRTEIADLSDKVARAEADVEAASAARRRAAAVIALAARRRIVRTALNRSFCKWASEAEAASKKASAARFIALALARRQRQRITKAWLDWRVAAANSSRDRTVLRAKEEAAAQRRSMAASALLRIAASRLRAAAAARFARWLRFVRQSVREEASARAILDLVAKQRFRLLCGAFSRFRAGVAFTRLAEERSRAAAAAAAAAARFADVEARAAEAESAARHAEASRAALELSAGADNRLAAALAEECDTLRADAAAAARRSATAAAAAAAVARSRAVAKALQHCVNARRQQQLSLAWRQWSTAAAASTAAESAAANASRKAFGASAVATALVSAHEKTLSSAWLKWRIFAAAASATDASELRHAEEVLRRGQLRRALRAFAAAAAEKCKCVRMNDSRSRALRSVLVAAEARARTGQVARGWSAICSAAARSAAAAEHRKRTETADKLTSVAKGELLLRAVTQRVRTRRLATALSSWRAMAQMEAESEVKLERVFAREQRQREKHLLAKRFQSWALFAKEMRRRRQVAGDVARQRHVARQADAFAAWKRTNEQVRHRRVILTRLLKRRSRGAVELRSAVNQWRRYAAASATAAMTSDLTRTRLATEAARRTYQRKQLRAVVVRAAIRKRRAALWSCWRRWQREVVGQQTDEEEFYRQQEAALRGAAAIARACMRLEVGVLRRGFASLQRNALQEAAASVRDEQVAAARAAATAAATAAASTKRAAAARLLLEILRRARAKALVRAWSALLADAARRSNLRARKAAVAQILERYAAQSEKNRLRAILVAWRLQAARAAAAVREATVERSMVFREQRRGLHAAFTVLVAAKASAKRNALLAEQMAFRRQQQIVRRVWTAWRADTSAERAQTRLKQLLLRQTLARAHRSHLLSAFQRWKQGANALTRQREQAAAAKAKAATLLFSHCSAVVSRARRDALQRGWFSWLRNVAQARAAASAAEAAAAAARASAAVAADQAVAAEREAAVLAGTRISAHRAAALRASSLLLTHRLKVIGRAWSLWRLKTALLAQKAAEEAAEWRRKELRAAEARNASLRRCFNKLRKRWLVAAMRRWGGACALASHGDRLAKAVAERQSKTLAALARALRLVRLAALRTSLSRWRLNDAALVAESAAGKLQTEHSTLRFGAATAIISAFQAQRERQRVLRAWIVWCRATAASSAEMRVSRAAEEAASATAEASAAAAARAVQAEAEAARSVTTLRKAEAHTAAARLLVHSLAGRRRAVLRKALVTWSKSAASLASTEAQAAEGVYFLAQTLKRVSQRGHKAALSAAFAVWTLQTRRIAAAEARAAVAAAAELVPSAAELPAAIADAAVARAATSALALRVLARTVSRRSSADLRQAWSRWVQATKAESVTREKRLAAARTLLQRLRALRTKRLSQAFYSWRDAATLAERVSMERRLMLRVISSFNRRSGWRAMGRAWRHWVSQTVAANAAEAASAAASAAAEEQVLAQSKTRAANALSCWYITYKRHQTLLTLARAFQKWLSASSSSAAAEAAVRAHELGRQKAAAAAVLLRLCAAAERTAGYRTLGKAFRRWERMAMASAWAEADEMRVSEREEEVAYQEEMWRQHAASMGNVAEAFQEGTHRQHTATMSSVVGQESGRGVLPGRWDEAQQPLASEGVAPARAAPSSASKASTRASPLRAVLAGTDAAGFEAPQARTSSARLLRRQPERAGESTSIRSPGGSPAGRQQWRSPQRSVGRLLSPGQQRYSPQDIRESAASAMARSPAQEWRSPPPPARANGSATYTTAGAAGEFPAVHGAYRAAPVRSSARLPPSSRRGEASDVSVSSLARRPHWQSPPPPYPSSREIELDGTADYSEEVEPEPHRPLVPQRQRPAAPAALDSWPSAAAAAAAWRREAEAEARGPRGLEVVDRLAWVMLRRGFLRWRRNDRELALRRTLAAAGDRMLFYRRMQKLRVAVVSALRRESYGLHASETARAMRLWREHTRRSRRREAAATAAADGRSVHFSAGGDAGGHMAGAPLPA